MQIMKTSHYLKKAGAVCMAAVMMTGCAGGSSGANGKTLTVGLNTGFNGIFSPLYYQTVYDDYVIEMVYQSMLSYDRDNQLQPQLATEQPTISEDGSTLTFKLKKGVKFSDGSKLDADDVVLTFTAMADPSYTGRFSTYVDYLEGYKEYHDGDAKTLSGVEKIDDYTVAFHLATPRIDAISQVGTFPIISNSQFKKYKKGDTKMFEDKASEPIGTGPYVLKNFQKDSAATFVKNDKFKAKDGEYQIDNVVMKICDTSTELQELQKGTVDLLPQADNADKVGTASLDKNLTYNNYASSSMQYFIYNCEAGATADPAVRQALTYAIDRQSFVDSYYSFSKGSKDVKKTQPGFVPVLMANPISSQLGDIITGKEKDDNMTYYDYDIEKAKQILDDAGWTVGSDGIREKDGQKLSIKFLATKEKDAMDTMIPMLQKQWGELGVDFKANTMEFNTVIATVSDDSAVGDWDVSYLGNSFTSPEDTSVDYFIQSQGVNNLARLKDDELDSYLAAGAYTADKDASAAAYLKAYVRQAELCAYLPTDGVQTYCLRNKKVKGLNTSSTFIWSQSMATAYIDD